MPSNNDDNSYLAFYIGLFIILIILIACVCYACNKNTNIVDEFSALRVTQRATQRPRAAAKRATKKPTKKPKVTKRATQKPKPKTRKPTTRKPVIPRSMTILRNFFGNVYDTESSIPNKFNLRNYITVYSISNSPYQEWQADLLDYSFIKSGQPGTLVRLVSDDADYIGRETPVSKVTNAVTIHTPAYENIGSEMSYKPMNKPGSLLYMLNKTEFGKNLKDDDVILLVDPDMIFTKPWTPDFTGNVVYGQKWKGYSKEFCNKTSGPNSRFCPKSDNEAVMYPFAIYVKDLKKITPDYYDFSKYFSKSKNWMQEMTALDLAINRNRLKIETEENIGLCNDWDNNNDEEAPLIHYCQTVKDKDGKEIWGKHNYRPGNSVPDSSKGLNRVDRVVLEYVKELYYR